MPHPVASEANRDNGLQAVGWQEAAWSPAVVSDRSGSHIRSASSYPTKIIVSFTFSVALSLQITEKNNEKTADEQKNKPKIPNLVPQPTIAVQPLFGARNISPSSSKIELFVLFVSQLHHLVLLLSHQQTTNS